MSKLGLDEFLSHSGRSGGGSVLSWRDDGKVVIWIHPESPIHALWSHTWYDRVKVENKDTGDQEVKIFRRRFVCHERELICKKQNFRDKATGQREYPPEVCPLDFMVDAVVDLVKKGTISWTDPIFEFIGDDEKYNTTLHAAGIYGAFKSDKMSREERGQIRKAKGIRLDEAWKEDVRVKLSYLFTGVSDPTEGIVAMIEPKGLGDKMKKEIGAAIRRDGREAGDPTINPYPFEWTFDETKDFDEKYGVVALKDKPTKEILELLRESPPSQSKYTEPGDCLWLYESMKETCINDAVRERIDSFFEVAKSKGLMDPKDDADEGDADVDADGIPNIGPGAGADDDEEQPYTEGAQLFECDHCGKETLKETDRKCSACGAEYDDQNRLCVRPCVKCDAPVKLDAKEKSHTCAKCKTVHEEKEDATGRLEWIVTKSPDVPAEQPTGGRRRRAAAPDEAKAGEQAKTQPAPEEKQPAKKDTIPWGKQ